MFPNPEYLTHPNIPKPLHGVNPRSIKGQAWWDKVRREAYKKYDYHCWACGISKWDAMFHNWLEAHEHYDINYETGEVKLIEIIALCHSCHNFIHSGRLWKMYCHGEVDKGRADYILRHGFRVLKEAGLEPFEGTKLIWFMVNDREDEYIPPKEDDQPMANWWNWHLILDGEKHYSPYEDIHDWSRQMREKYG